MKLTKYINELKNANLLPKKIEASNWNGWNLVSCYNIEDDLNISENVAMGVDPDKEIAFYKALTEFAERKIIKDNSNDIIKITPRTDGFAAYPTNIKDSHLKVRANALNEAIERFLWATWWDNFNVSCKIETDNNNKLFNNIVEEFNLENIFIIKVTASNYPTELTIIIAKIKNYGFVSGGAAGNSYEENRNRAFGELLRHLLVSKKFISSKSVANSFYEKRLQIFCSGELNDLVYKRLQTNGNFQIKLPRLDQPGVFIPLPRLDLHGKLLPVRSTGFWNRSLVS